MDNNTELEKELISEATDAKNVADTEKPTFPEDNANATDNTDDTDTTGDTEFTVITATETQLEIIDSENSDSKFNNSFENNSQEFEEPSFTSDFTVNYIRKKANAARKGKFLQTYPKALLYSVLMMLPTFIIFILGSVKTTDSVLIGRIIQIIGALIPVLFGGSLFLGFMSGIMKICRGESFKLKDLFSFCTDYRFGKALGSYLLMNLICILTILICQIPVALISFIAGEASSSAGLTVLLFIYEIIAFIVYLMVASRFIMAFMLIIDYPKISVFKAMKLSFKGMKNNCKKFVLMLFSYIGWYALSTIVALLLIVIIYTLGMTSIMEITDFLTYYMAMLKFMLFFYVASYLIIMFACSTVITRPAFGITAFYDTMIGRQWDIKIEDAFVPEEWAVIGPDNTNTPTSTTESSASYDYKTENTVTDVGKETELETGLETKPETEPETKLDTE